MSSPTAQTSHLDSLQWTTLRLARRCHAEARAFAMNLAPSVDREAILALYAEADQLYDNLHAALRRDDLRCLAALTPASPSPPCHPADAPPSHVRTEAAA